MSSPKCVIFFEQEIPLILADNTYGILTGKFQECLWRHCQDRTGHWELICDKEGEDYSTCTGPRVRSFKYFECFLPPIPNHQEP